MADLPVPQRGQGQFSLHDLGAEIARQGEMGLFQLLHNEELQTRFTGGPLSEDGKREVIAGARQAYPAVVERYEEILRKQQRLQELERLEADDKSWEHFNAKVQETWQKYLYSPGSVFRGKASPHAQVPIEHENDNPIAIKGEISAEIAIIQEPIWDPKSPDWEFKEFKVNNPKRFINVSYLQFRDFFLIDVDLSRAGGPALFNEEGVFVLQNGNPVPWSSGSHSGIKPMEWDIVYIKISVPNAKGEQKEWTFYLINKDEIPLPEVDSAGNNLQLTSALRFAYPPPIPQQGEYQKAVVLRGETINAWCVPKFGTYYYSVVWYLAKGSDTPVVKKEDENVDFSMLQLVAGGPDFDDEGEVYYLTARVVELIGRTDPHNPVSTNPTQTIRGTDKTVDQRMIIEFIEPKIEKLTTEFNESGSEHEIPHVYHVEASTIYLDVNFLDVALDYKVFMTKFTNAGNPPRSWAGRNTTELTDVKAEAGKLKATIPKARFFEPGKKYVLWVEMQNDDKTSTLKTPDDKNHNVIEIRDKPSLDAVELYQDGINAPFDEYTDDPAHTDPYDNYQRNDISIRSAQFKLAVKHPKGIDEVKAKGKLKSAFASEEKTISFSSPHTYDTAPSSEETDFNFTVEGGYRDVLFAEIEIEYIYKGGNEKHTEKKKYKLYFDLPPPVLTITPMVNGNEWVPPVHIGGQMQHTVLAVPKTVKIVYLDEGGSLDDNHRAISFNIACGQSTMFNSVRLVLRVVLVKQPRDLKSAMYPAGAPYIDFDHHYESTLKKIALPVGDLVLDPSHFHLKVKVGDNELSGMDAYNFKSGRRTDIRQESIFEVEQGKSVDVQLSMDFENINYKEDDFAIFCQVYTIDTIQLSLNNAAAFDGVYTASPDAEMLLHVITSASKYFGETVRSLASINDTSKTIVIRHLVEEFVKHYLEENKDEFAPGGRRFYIIGARAMNPIIQKIVHDLVSYIGNPGQLLNSYLLNPNANPESPDEVFFVIALATLLYQDDEFSLPRNLSVIDLKKMKALVEENIPNAQATFTYGEIIYIAQAFETRLDDLMQS